MHCVLSNLSDMSSIITYFVYGMNHKSPQKKRPLCLVPRNPEKNSQDDQEPRSTEQI